MRLVLDARARALLRRLPRTNVYSAFELLLLAALAVQCARLVWTVATPVGPLGDWRPAQAGFAGSPSAVLQGFDPFFRLSGVDGKPAIVTSLQLTLFGTRLDEAMGGGSAIIAGPDGVQQSVPVGQEIMPGVRLKAVAFDHVTIDRGGAEEDLFIAQGDPANPGAAPTSSTAPPDRMGRRLRPLPATPRGSRSRNYARISDSSPGSTAGRSAGSSSGRRARAARSARPACARAISLPPSTAAPSAHRTTSIASAPNSRKGGNLSITIERGGQTLPLAITIAGQ